MSKFLRKSWKYCAFMSTLIIPCTIVPFIIGEVISDSMLDLRRMLMQGMALVRTMNFLLDGERNFFVIAIYVTEEFIAKRYILYLKNPEGQQVSHV